MIKLLNTLYVTSPDAYLSLEGETVVILKGDVPAARIPLHNLCSIVSFGYTGCSPALMGSCAARGIDLCFLTQHGRFLARVQGPVNGNVLLRQTQAFIAGDPQRALPLARNFLGAKLHNARWCLERTKRDHALRIDMDRFQQAIERIKAAQHALLQQEGIDGLLGQEGLAAKAYFDVFPQRVLRDGDAFCFAGRTRRPPRDRVNALLSLAYTLLAKECAAALETVGLDPCVGFLHQLRPGRSSLALDLLEEFRAPIADRFVLMEINTGRIQRDDFTVQEDGACYLTEDARKRFLTDWQARKQQTILHPFLKETIMWGLVPYAQAMQLSRHLRGDLDAYPPFLWK